MAYLADQDSPASASRRGGPRTPEGKARSSRNAVRHGLNCPPPYDPAVEAQTAGRAEWLARGDARLAAPARAVADAWARLERVRATWRDVMYRTLFRPLAAGEMPGPGDASRELKAIDRYERRARAALSRCMEELDAARLGLVRAPQPLSPPAPPADPYRERRKERCPWWLERDPARRITRYLASCGYVLFHRLRDWLGRGWVWADELAPDEGAGSLSVTPTPGAGPATQDRVPVPVAARAAAACATPVSDERAKRTAPLISRHSGQAAPARGADPEPSSSALDEGRAATSATLAGSRIGAADAAPSGMTGIDVSAGSADRAERTAAAGADPADRGDDFARGGGP